jgi:hypothetical protein
MLKPILSVKRLKKESLNFLSMVMGPADLVANYPSADERVGDLRASAFNPFPLQVRLHQSIL